VALSVGSRLGPYEILSLLGAGGMGEVYRARDPRLARDVAVKLITGSIDGNARAHLLEEARSAAALNHPHICTIHEIGEADNRVFIVMEHIDGRPLSMLVDSGLPTTTAISYGIQIADALSHAHERGVVHRDLKNTNLMVTSDGRVKLLDFGIARRLDEAGIDELTRMPTITGTVTGTPAYMAPEALRAAPVDRRSDIWALGIVLYEMLARRRPFRGDTSFEITSAILRDDPEPLEAHVPAPLRAIIGRCLAKDPALRYQHAGEVRAALEAISTLTTTRKRSGSRLRTGAPKSRDVASRIRSVAVLPLVNLSRDPEQEYFADGMTDALIGAVAQIEGLRVISRTSIMRYKETQKSIRQIARDLNVAGIITGSVRELAIAYGSQFSCSTLRPTVMCGRRATIEICTTFCRSRPKSVEWSLQKSR